MNSYLKSIGFISILAVLCPLEAFAVQQHGGAEGLVAHQIGHALFVVGIGYLLYKIYQVGLKSSGWFEFKTFLWLITAWNVLTFTGHLMKEYVDPEKFTLLNRHVISYNIDSLADAYFYLTRLDHLLLVPAFFFLFLSLHRWGQRQ